jgi:hypothetical protein
MGRSFPFFVGRGPSLRFVIGGTSLYFNPRQITAACFDAIEISFGSCECVLKQLGLQLQHLTKAG